jgi:thiol:disulfide interchange protein
VRLIFNLLVAVIIGAALPANAAHTRATLILSADAAKAGDTVTAGIHLQMDAKWHTYWKNSGASGDPTKIQWELPTGITAGEIQWPLPEKYGSNDLITFVYHDEAMLLVSLKLGPDVKSGPVEIKAKVSWLECEEVCVKGSSPVSANLQIGAESKPSASAPLLQQWEQKLPKPANGLTASGRWEKGSTGEDRPLIVEWNFPASATEVDFFPYAGGVFDVSPDTKILSKDAGKASIRTSVFKFQGDWPKEITGVLIHRVDGKREGIEVKVPITGEGASKTSSTAPIPMALLIQMLFYAFLGGLILNIMPCVFPVIALKILGFVQQSKEEPKKVFRLGIIYAFGVIASFAIMAGIVISVQQAGGSASWGMQMQNPHFTLFLTALVTLVALNLFGVFEVNLGGAAMGKAGELASKQGPAGAFFNGVLATALATPCTAPFLAPALGFAFAQPPAIIISIFMAVALGLAFPYIVLSAKPQWLKFLPKPGAWMERFKVAMGFPMLATAVWLFSFTAKQFGNNGTLRLGIFLVLIALAAWIWGQFVQRGSRGKALAVIISLLLVVAGYGYAMMREAAGWQKWSPEAVAEARANGKPVLVDFTADWCLTCKYNKRFAIEVPEVKEKLNKINAVTLTGDNTGEDPAIVAELKKFERAGVPLVLIFPSDSSKEPIVLPPLLTKSIVLNALDQAVH